MPGDSVSGVKKDITLTFFAHCNNFLLGVMMNINRSAFFDGMTDIGIIFPKEESSPELSMDSAWKGVEKAFIEAGNSIKKAYTSKRK